MRNTVRAMLASLLCLALAACLLSPGRFSSALDVRRDGRFTFTYTGEIHLLALTRLAEMGGRADTGTFAAKPCLDDAGRERPCSARETADQKAAWEQARTAAADKRRNDAERWKHLLGGIDPASPRAAEELAQRLRRQAGWRRVDYKGDGLFDVDFAIEGRLDHDFTFPTIERFPLANGFVTIGIRNDGTVRIDAPAFTPMAAGEPWRQMIGAAAVSRPGNSPQSPDRRPPFPEIDGRFVIRTDAAIIANNTDEGPQGDAAGQRLEWSINTRSAAAPMALLRLR